MKIEDQLINSKYNYYSKHAPNTGQHYPTFYHFASKCESIVEMGVEHGYGSWAWIAARPKSIVALDVNRSTVPDEQISWIEHVAEAAGVNYQFIIGDSSHGALREINHTRQLQRPLDPNDPTLFRDPYTIDGTVDLLYIDTYHSYTHLKVELQLHAKSVKKYIICHDTEAFGERHDFDGDKGLNYAIDEFVAENPNWIILHKVSYSQGLTVLANTDNTDDVPNLDSNFRYPDIILDEN